MQIFLDTETAGLDPNHDEILEILIVDEAGRVLLDSGHRCEDRGGGDAKGL